MKEQIDLFQQASHSSMLAKAPLAERMRPKRLEDIVGQDHILQEGKLLRRAIESDKLTSLIFWGDPGCGKTSLVKVIAKITKKNFCQLNAVTANIGDIREVIKQAQDYINLYDKQTILFIDEIHRFNKAQQDGLLPAVEQGIIVLIGLTTQNPYFSVNPALLSRSLIFKLNPLSNEAIQTLLAHALIDKEHGLGLIPTIATDEGLKHLAHSAQGDARIALNALELAVLSTAPAADGKRYIDLSVAEESIQQPSIVYDGTGDQHYDVISAFIKSIRGSDANAALHYLARMLVAGEDLMFIARRLVILASEDIGMADPNALVIAQAASQSIQFIGMPESRIILSQTVVYLSEAPKSNACYLAIDKAIADVKKGLIGSVPTHLKDAHYPGAKKLNHGQGYLYPHNFANHYVKQQYLPDLLADKEYYIADETAFNKKRGHHD